MLFFLVCVKEVADAVAVALEKELSSPPNSPFSFDSSASLLFLILMADTGFMIIVHTAEPSAQSPGTETTLDAVTNAINNTTKTIATLTIVTGIWTICPRPYLNRLPQDGYAAPIYKDRVSRLVVLVTRHDAQGHMCRISGSIAPMSP
ncbi:hypothetical protein ACJJTC_015593 [Scirpophaga incertulas]